MKYSLGNKSPLIHSSSYVAPGAYIIGDVELKEYSSVWFNAVLRGDNEKITIGKGSNIQEGTVVHTDIGFPTKVYDYVTIGHNVTLHGCTIMGEALIGMGSTILNGAVVGKGSLIAAGSLVKEGMEIAPGMLVAGVPAKEIRKLTESDLEKIKFGAQYYIDNKERFRNQLQIVD